MSTTLLEIDNLRTYFHTDDGVVRAVDGISLQIKEGQTLGVVGESGSGKSVTAFSVMRLLAGTAKIETGRIALLGQNLVKLPEADMRKIRGKEISMIFQEPMTSLNPVFTVGWQVMEAIMLHQKVSKAEARKRSIELFREVGIPDPETRIDSYPHQMSGGQKQRVMIAMALSCNPKLLIADEPSTALDVTIQAQILDILRQLRDQRGMSVLFITHDLGVIAEIADEVAVMFQGKIVEYGKVLEIFERPQHPYTKGLLACKPKLQTNYKVLPTVADFMEVVEEKDGQTRIVEKKITPERLEQLTTQGRGRLLHPQSKLAEMGHPWEEEKHPPDTKTVPEDQPPLLSVKGLKVYFPIRRGIFLRTVGHVKAVDGVSFDVYRGQTLGLVGESGCGKTTAGRAILRLIEPTAGRVI
ncbi:MAG TPA: ABC transporter ATP-binding protein, partial [Pirellulaceae bacterium]|nr:ABC transporter ATP-binding protein [Pirellulaceae bacterium]